MVQEEEKTKISASTDLPSSPDSFAPIQKVRPSRDSLEHLDCKIYSMELWYLLFSYDEALKVVVNTEPVRRG